MESAERQIRLWKQTETDKQRRDIYNKAIDNWCFKMTKAQKAKYKSPICGSGMKPQASFIQYVDVKQLCHNIQSAQIHP